MMPFFGKYKYKLAVAALGIFFLILSVRSILHYEEIRSSRFDEAIAKAEQQLQSASLEIDERLKKLENIALGLEKRLSEKPIEEDELIARLDSGVRKYPEIYGFGVGYEPYEWHSSRRLYAPFIIKPGDEYVLTYVDTSYDYTLSEWYTRPRDNGAAWFEPPYFGQVAQTMFAEFSVPFSRTIDGSKDTIGLVYIDISLSKLNAIVNSLDLGKSGYGFVVSKTGNFIAHPISEWVKSKKNISEFAKEYGEPKIMQLFREFDVGGKDYLDIVNSYNQRKSRLMMAEIPSAGWRLGIIYSYDDLLGDTEELNKTYIRILIYSIGCLIALVVILFTGYESSLFKLWFAVGLISLLFVTGIGIIWDMALKRPVESALEEDSYIITDKTVLKKFIRLQDSLYLSMHEKLPEPIPTGTYIENLEFVDANTIRLSGFVWQKLDSGLRTKFSEGIFFPETSPDAEALDIKEMYRVEENGALKIGWYFRVAIRQELDFKPYPFDRQIINLRLWQKDGIAESAFLVPDLDAYTFTNPSMAPGIVSGIPLRGWKLKGSYFDFEKTNYSTTFGVINNFTNKSRYELNFNIVTERKFLGPFITNIIPLIVISLLLFTIVMSSSRKERDITFGFTGFGVLEVCAAFFFVVILAHIDLRNLLGVQEIIYLDYFYFLIYIKILIYAVNSILFAKYENIKIVQMRDNLIPRMLYWPVYLLSLFLITCYVFY
jgi:hypothetical protein